MLENVKTTVLTISIRIMNSGIDKNEREGRNGSCAKSKVNDNTNSEELSANLSLNFDAVSKVDAPSRK